MAKNENQQEVVVAEAVGKTEKFFQENGKYVMVGLLAVVIVVVAGYFYKSVIIDGNAEKASEMIVEAQERFGVENPDFVLALNGDDNGAGFLDVVEQYGSTPAGNLAKHYAGICYLKTGDLEQAAAYLAKFKPVKGVAGAIINAQNLGLQGDVAVAQGDYKQAVALFNKAAAAAENNLTTPLYLRKAGQAEQAAGNVEAAAAYYERIMTEYPASMEARDAEKLMGTIR